MKFWTNCSKTSSFWFWVNLPEPLCEVHSLNFVSTFTSSSISLCLLCLSISSVKLCVSFCWVGFLPRWLQCWGRVFFMLEPWRLPLLYQLSFCPSSSGWLHRHKIYWEIINKSYNQKWFDIGLCVSLFLLQYKVMHYSIFFVVFACVWNQALVPFSWLTTQGLLVISTKKREHISFVFKCLVGLALVCLTKMLQSYALYFRSADQSLLVVPKSKRRLRRHFFSCGISSPKTLDTTLLSQHIHLPCSRHIPPILTLLCCIFPPLLIAWLSLFSRWMSSTCFWIVSPITNPTWRQPPLHLCPGKTTRLLSLTTIIACHFLIPCLPVAQWLECLFLINSHAGLDPHPA